MTPAFPSAEPPRWLRWAFRLLGLGLGALHTVVAVRSQSMNEDGINYLDLGDAWWNGDWGAIVNTTWSPLYAWILGIVVNLTRPSVWWEFPVVQVTNFLLFALTLGCFELIVRRARPARRSRGLRRPSSRHPSARQSTELARPDAEQRDPQADLDPVEDGVALRRERRWEQLTAAFGLAHRWLSIRYTRNSAPSSTRSWCASK